MTSKRASAAQAPTGQPSDLNTDLGWAREMAEAGDDLREAKDERRCEIEDAIGRLGRGRPELARETAEALDDLARIVRHAEPPPGPGPTEIFEAAGRLGALVGMLPKGSVHDLTVQLVMSAIGLMGKLDAGPAADETGVATCARWVSDRLRQALAAQAGAKLVNGARGREFEFVVGRGQRWDFHTPQQRAIVRALYDAWQEGGEGAPVTTAALLGALREKAVRLRMDKTFAGSPALGTIICEGKGKGTWRLYLYAPPPPSE